jgi:hypothetical protein
MSRIAVILAVAFLPAFVQLGQAESEVGSEPLSPPPPGAKTVEISAVGAFRQTGNQQGAFRTVFEGLGPGGVKVEVRDVTVAPKAKVTLPAVKGAVVFDTRSGEGVANIGDRSIALQITSAASASAAGPIELQNQGEGPLVLIIYTAEGQ